MTRADPHRRRPVRLARRTRRGRAWPAGRSRPAGMGSWSGPPTRRTVPAGTASRERGSRSASRSSTGRAGGWRSRRRGRARRSRFLPGRTVGREHRPDSRSVQVHSAATRGSPHIAVPSPPQILLPCAAHQSECGRTPPARGRHHEEDPSPMTPPETVSTTTSGDAHATAPITRTFGPQGPTLGDLSDAYLQDYQVRQFRSHSTARGRTAHLTAFFGRAARATALTTYQIRQYQLDPARRRGRHRHHQPGDLGPPPHVHARRPLGLARHRARLPRPPPRESPPPGLLRAPRIPRRPRPHLPAPWQDILDLAYYSGWRKQEILGLTWEEIDDGRWRHPALAGSLEDAGGADSPHLTPHCRRAGTTAGTPRPRQPARLPPRRHPRPPLAHGVAHRLPGRWGADSLPSRLSAYRRPQPDPRECPRAGRHAPDRAQEPRHLRPLQHHSTSRNCSTPGTNSSRISRNRRRRYQPASGPTRPDPPPRAPHHPSASYDAAPRKGARPPGNSSRPRTGGRRVAGHRPSVRRGLHPGPRVRAGPRSWHTWQRGGPTRPNTDTRRARLRVHAGRLDATRRRRATPASGVTSYCPKTRSWG